MDSPQRDYLDESIYQIARSDEAMAVLEEAMQHAPYKTEYDQRQTSKLLSAALDIMRDSIPKSSDLICEYVSNRPNKQNERPA